jgi:hypothetical protein
MKARTKLYIVAALAAALIAAAPLALRAAEEQPAEKTPTVDEIVQKANQVAYYQGGTGRAHVHMTIYDARGKVRGERQLIMLRRNVPDSLDQKSYAYFEKPEDVRGTAYLVWKHNDRDDDRWLYNPSLDLVVRISAADKRASFVGTNFCYEDVSGRSIDADKHELRQVTQYYYIVRNTPKDADTVEFSYYDTYILRSNYLPVYAYYYDKKGQKYKEYKVLKVEDVKGYPTATQAEMIDYREQGLPNTYAHTLAEYSDIEYGVDLPDDIFTERYLRTPPRDYLK